MGRKSILTILFLLLVVLLMAFYFIPFNTSNFYSTGNNNFSITPGSEMQFYPNMRFPDPEISYKISNCPLQKQNDMKFAFEILENLTSLEFYSVGGNEEISVTCEERARVENGLFIPV